MEKKLKIKALYELQDEIKILIGQDVNHLFKLELIELFEELGGILTSANKIKQELVVKNLGELAPTMPQSEAEQLPGYPTFVKEWEEVVEEEREFKYTPVKKKYLDFASPVVLYHLYKLVEKDI